MSKLVQDSNGHVLQLSNPYKMHSVLSISGTATQSSTISDTTTLVEIWSSVDAFYSVGTNPTATTTPGINNIRLRGDIPRTIFIQPSSKISIVTEGSSGTAEIIEYM